MATHYVLKFKQGELSSLRARILEDLSRESFVILFGKKESIGTHEIINVIEARFPNTSDYNARGIAHLGMSKDFIYDILVEITNRYDIDTIIDVHTHPFCRSKVSFSSVDDRDEIGFFEFLNERFENLHYASIVFSQSEYSARVWKYQKKSVGPCYALIKTQTIREKISSSDFMENTDRQYERDAVDNTDGFFNRGALALGLDVMRQIMHGQTLSIVGVGGLGSIIAEHLIHMGFHKINLIDPDILEISNMNRIVGAYYRDAEENRAKVDVVKKHLDRINPHASVSAYKNDIHDKIVEEVLAISDWLILSTDNHSSRFRTQQIALQYFVPLISVGVNISVQDGAIEDMSGEVITIRVGDKICLNCLNRINPIKVAHERHPDPSIRNELEKRGYVVGRDVKEPAVKTLNAFLATLAVDVLINQYTEHQKHIPILVFENNKYKASLL